MWPVNVLSSLLMLLEKLVFPQQFVFPIKNSCDFRRNLHVCKSKNKNQKTNGTLGVCISSLIVMHIFQLHVWPKGPDYLRNLFVVGCMPAWNKQEHKSEYSNTVCVFLSLTPKSSASCYKHRKNCCSLLWRMVRFLFFCWALMKNLNVRSPMS